MRVNVFLNLEGNRQLAGSLVEKDGIVFQYFPSFIQSDLQLSPLALPLSRTPWKSTREIFGGLPGFIADSLPDGWGNLLLDRQLRKKGLRLHQISPLQRLCWVGDQGMGALEYEPALSGVEVTFDSVQLDAFSENIQKILEEKESNEVLDALSQMNGSSGGARPKIVCLVSDDFQSIRQGTKAENGFKPWIIKFRHSEDSRYIGIYEYLSSIIARQAGLMVPRTHLFESDKGPGWFGIERFDRSTKGKIHMVTASGLLHCNFREPCLDYESLLALVVRMVGSSSLIEMFKRAVLNFSLGNIDDHAKNFSFLMNGSGVWSLSPVYDLVPSENPMAEHMTSVLGVGRNPDRKLFLDLASKFDITRKSAISAMDEVAAAVNMYTELAKQYQVKVPNGVKEI